MGADLPQRSQLVPLHRLNMLPHTHTIDTHSSVTMNSHVGEPRVGGEGEGTDVPQSLIL